MRTPGFLVSSFVVIADLLAFGSFTNPEPVPVDEQDEAKLVRVAVALETVERDGRILGAKVAAMQIELLSTALCESMSSVPVGAAMKSVTSSPAIMAL